MSKVRVASIAFGLTLLLSSTGATAGALDWEKFAQSPGGLAAIAMGLATLGSCSQPYVFTQDDGDDKTVSVSVQCSDADGESAVIILFDRIGEHLVPRRIDLAG